MPRHFGLGHYQLTRKPRAARLGIALGAGLLVALLAFASHAAPVTCNQLGCSDWHGHERKPAKRRSVDAHGNSVSLAGIVEPLKSKAREIVAACGSRVVSAYRPGARIPSGRVSNHARHRAVDIRGNPSCIYAHLKGWPGGYSTDYARAPGGPHVHISYNRNMEWGARFRHSGRSFHARRRK